jgi:hypothetical protein
MPRLRRWIVLRHRSHFAARVNGESRCDVFWNTSDRAATPMAH